MVASHPLERQVGFGKRRGLSWRPHQPASSSKCASPQCHQRSHLPRTSARSRRATCCRPTRPHDRPRAEAGRYPGYRRQSRARSIQIPTSTGVHAGPLGRQANRERSRWTRPSPMTRRRRQMLDAGLWRRWTSSSELVLQAGAPAAPAGAAATGVSASRRTRWRQLRRARNR